MTEIDEGLLVKLRECDTDEALNNFFEKDAKLQKSDFAGRNEYILAAMDKPKLFFCGGKEPEDEIKYNSLLGAFLKGVWKEDYIGELASDDVRELVEEIRKAHVFA